jgi:hypothetical protein
MPNSNDPPDPRSHEDEIIPFMAAACPRLLMATIVPSSTESSNGGAAPPRPSFQLSQEIQGSHERHWRSCRHALQSSNPAVAAFLHPRDFEQEKQITGHGLTVDGEFEDLEALYVESDLKSGDDEEDQDQAAHRRGCCHFCMVPGFSLLL